MLATDLYGWTVARIAQFVRDTCSQYGTVSMVSVHLYPLQFGLHKPFALVEMSKPQENTEVREAIGDSYFGNAVLVNLVRTSAACPYAMRTPDCFRRGRCLLGLSCPAETARH